MLWLPSAEMSEDQVRLTLPASPDYLRFARLTAASLASLLAFSYDEVEDLRLAVDEVCFALLGSGPPWPTATDPTQNPAPGQASSLHLLYTTTDTRIEVVASLHGSAGPACLSDFGRRILFALVDAYELREGNGQSPSIWICKARARVGPA